MHDVFNAQPAGGRPIGDEHGSARDRAQLDGQLGVQRHVGALLAQRGLDGVLFCFHAEFFLLFGGFHLFYLTSKN